MIKYFIHTIIYLNIQGHVENLFVFNVMFHFYLQKPWITIFKQDIDMLNLLRRHTNVQYVKKSAKIGKNCILID